MADTGRDLAAALDEFRTALGQARKPRIAVVPGMRLYDAAMAAATLAPGGFAPIAGGGRRQVGLKRKSLASAGEERSVQAERSMPRTDAMGWATAQSGNEVPSYRAVVTQAKEQAAAATGQRQAGRAALLLPAREREAVAMSFAPMSRAGGTGGVTLHPAQKGRPVVPGLRRGGSVHEAVAVAEVEAGSCDAGEGAEGQPYPYDVSPAPDDVSPAPAQAVIVEPSDIRQALDEYFFRQSRLPPNGGAAFNPLLSPIWAGLKLPG
jgi:hypothetical protein